MFIRHDFGRALAVSVHKIELFILKKKNILYDIAAMLYSCCLMIIYKRKKIQ